MGEGEMGEGEYFISKYGNSMVRGRFNLDI